ncbi:hypothetical protein M406DRAFT_254939 [Cryphonectria parasitica EP155]|uniref:RRN7-type domain-containing protein n=1 Tax=Cryphonectria parasitica (strain ATCC 38755 / EP155) TaxID=660469 RepID=A0A9P4Y7B7_CRYP1|nr:uncharacterized protein M406DRAFT_254939 [Cryphonectria parasitica EP155]KAF3767697.1 hypothetical protein M406DRAFT_254939 [Cryphonectria parasitica EP155]
MTGRKENLHRFPSGERCDECRAKRWYLESGFRYCENGHRIEGFVEVDIDEEDNFGQTGRISRKEREVKEKATRHLAGNEARELYLECLQLVLRRQVWWLVHERRLPAELETVVRDLWDLRIRSFAGLKRTAAAEETDTEMDSGTDDEFFSSQAGSESDASTVSTRTTASRARSWTSEAGQDWNMPGLFHCLALCYLGCLSLSLPVRVGQIYEWARSDQLPFLGAFDALPKEMTDRLPGSYHRALMVKHTSFQGGELHQAVLELILEYHLNYDMVFPALNTPLLLFHYLRELALPAEVYVHVRAMIRLLSLIFTFNMKKKRFRLLDHPDVLLIASVVFSTKLIYPFDGKERPPLSYRDPSSLQMDWDRWRELMRDSEAEGLERRDINKLQPEDVWSMSDKKIDDYLDWYEETQIKHGTETQELRELFPLSQRRRQVSRNTLTEDEIDERLKTAQSYIRSVAPAAGGWLLRAGDAHAIYRSVDDLPETARAFYGKAAELSGLSLGRLVKAVYTLERSVGRWCVREEKAAKGISEGDQSEQDSPE